MKIPRVYLDTSVIGGCEDDEFMEASRALLRDAGEGRLVLVVSDLLAQELIAAPESVGQILEELTKLTAERVSTTVEVVELAERYLRDGILGQASRNDALHVALATVAGADLLASWNFKHIVHFDKARRFNAVNLREGYGMLEIRSPREIAQP